MAKENLQEDIFGGSKKFNKTFFKKKGGRMMLELDEKKIRKGKPNGLT